MDQEGQNKSSNFSRFLDIPLSTNPFGRNRLGDRMYRRTERLAAAVYLISNHLPEDESLRTEIRKIATRLLEKALECRDFMRTSTSTVTVEYQVLIRRLISLVRLLVFAGFVSPQNGEVVAGAADELGSFIKSANRSALAENISISRDDLLNVPEGYKGQKDRTDVKDIRRLKDSSDMSDRGSLGLAEGGVATVPARSEEIIGILRGGGEMNIRDIAANLPEYGEKTIQRDLANLVQRGLVRRVGLKRWSRYSLGSQ